MATDPGACVRCGSTDLMGAETADGRGLTVTCLTCAIKEQAAQIRASVDERTRTRALVARVHPRADAALVDRLTDAAVKDPAYVSWMAARLAEEMLAALVQDLADEADDAKACVADARDTGLSPNKGVVDYQLGRYHAAEAAGDRVRAILTAIRGGD